MPMPSIARRQPLRPFANALLLFLPDASATLPSRVPVKFPPARLLREIWLKPQLWLWTWTWVLI
jgi:hypothetical protein